MAHEFISRADLAKRWHVSMKSVDRLRAAKLLSAVDISGKRGKRSTIRFRFADVLAFETAMDDANDNTL